MVRWLSVVDSIPMWTRSEAHDDNTARGVSNTVSKLAESEAIDYISYFLGVE